MAIVLLLNAGSGTRRSLYSRFIPIRKLLPNPRILGKSSGARRIGRLPRNPSPPSASVLSPKYEVFCRRSVGCFSRRSEPDWRRSAHIFVIRVERATRKNSQLAPAQRVAMKMGRRLRCSSVTYRFRYAPLLAPCRQPILIATKYMLFRGQDTK